MKIRKNQEGVAHLAAVLAVVVVVAIGVVGWKVWYSKKNTYKVPTQVTSTKSTPEQKKTIEDRDPYAGWKSYCDTLEVGCLKYPSDWVVTEDLEGQGPNVQLITPSNSKNGTNVMYTLASKGPVELVTSDNQVISKTELASSINGINVWKIVDEKLFQPSIWVASDTGGNIEHNDHLWFLSAVPVDSSYKNITQATAWFDSDNGKTAQKILQSFKYQ